MHDFTEKYKNIIIPILIKYLPDAKIILYGSRARGDFKEGSDIDVSVDSGSKIEDILMGKIMGDLEESNLPINYDIVDFWSVSNDMQKKIMEDGILWRK